MYDGRYIPDTFITVLVNLQADMVAQERERVKALFRENPFLSGVMCHVGSQVGDTSSKLMLDN